MQTIPSTRSRGSLKRKKSGSIGALVGVRDKLGLCIHRTREANPGTDNQHSRCEAGVSFLRISGVLVDILYTKHPRDSLKQQRKKRQP